MLMLRLVKLVLLVFLSNAAVSHALPFSGLYIFGDSLSDTGNVKAVAPGAVPPALYPLGRFTNGLNYADVLSQDLGLGPQATAWLNGGTNFAFGNARTGSHPDLDPLLPPPGVGLLGQIATYRALAAGAAPGADPGALYVVFAGGNDIRDAIVAGNPAIVVQAGNNIKTAVQNLIDEGARNILVANAPNIGRTPEAIANGAAAVAAGLALSNIFNAAVDANVDLLRLLNPGVHIDELDVFALLEQTILDAPGNGFTNTTDPCALVGPACDPNRYVFWDTIHPTVAAHRILGHAAAAAVAPEPAMLALFVLGALLLIGQRRRTARARR